MSPTAESIFLFFAAIRIFAKKKHNSLRVTLAQFHDFDYNNLEKYSYNTVSVDEYQTFNSLLKNKLQFHYYVVSILTSIEIFST